MFLRRLLFLLGSTALAAAGPALAALEVGDAAPDFTLAATGGREISLSELLGDKHVVLAFFPKAFTPG